MERSETIILLDSVDSTNTWLKNRLINEGYGSLSHASVVWAHEQTAGRGQRGNSWEATPGRNITMSLLLRPEGVDARSQFMISEAVALGVALTVDELLPEGRKATVKWPNDIYVEDRKLAGILIENSLQGSMVSASICGIGLNVNQEEFVSDAPNPVSLRQLTGREYPLEPIMSGMRERILDLIDYPAEELHSIYMGHLWRRTGLHRWHDHLTDKPLLASIESVSPMGFLTLREKSGELHTYAFKEVSAVLD